MKKCSLTVDRRSLYHRLSLSSDHRNLCKDKRQAEMVKKLFEKCYPDFIKRIFIDRVQGEAYRAPSSRCQQIVIRSQFVGICDAASPRSSRYAQPVKRKEVPAIQSFRRRSCSL